MRDVAKGFLACWLAVSGLLACATAVVADEVDIRDIQFPDDTKFVLALNLEKFRETQIGRRVLDLAKEKIQEELAKEAKGDGNVDLNAVNQILGFDPFEELQRIVILGSDYERPERTLGAVVDMKGTTGNLEGFMLALPGYEVEEIDGVRVHSARPDGHMRFFAVIEDGASGGRRITIAADGPNLEAVQRPGANGFGSFRPKGILELYVREFPLERMGDGPHTNIARILESLVLSVDESDDNLEVTVRLGAAKPELAEQLRQLTQGLVAAIQLAKSLEPDDEDLQKVAAIVQGSTTVQDGDETAVSVQLSADKILELIEQELQ